MSSRPGFPARLLLRWWVPFALLASGVALSVAASRYVVSTEKAQAQTEFNTDARQVAQQIQFRIDAYLEVVRAAGALLRASNEIAVTEFRAFVTALRLRERYPGLSAIGFAALTPQRELAQLLDELRLEGSRIEIWPPGTRLLYCPVLFLEPTLNNGKAVGFDLTTDTTLWPLVESARDSGEIRVSPTLPLVNQFGGATGAEAAVVILPIYRPREVLGTPENRQRAFVGAVLAPLRMAELLEEVTREITPDVILDVYDPSVAAAPGFLGSPQSGRGTNHLAQSIRVGDRQWVVLVSSRADTAEAEITEAAERTQLIGVVFSLLLFLISGVQIRAWRVAATQEAEIRASEQALRKTESDLRTMVDLERHARNEAQSASRAKDEFLTMISHELRTPLNAVIGWVSLLRSGVVRDERRGHALETIERNARLQAQLIEDLLDVSRLSMGKTRLDLRPVNLDTLITGVIDSFRPTAEARGLRLNVSIDTPGTTIKADANRMQQIVWNLVSNAIKFTPPGGQVDVHIERAGERVRLIVRDTGIGIRPEFLPHVFERFRQADSSTTRSYTGVGLGLAIVRELVQLHGGSITAASEGENRGSTFTLELPTTTGPTQPAALVAGGAVRPTLNGVRVLVVDDDRSTRELLSEALTAMHARPVVAASVAEALDRLMTDGADVVVSDIAMPEEDGLSLMRRIRALPSPVSRIPAIALTAYARAEDRERAVAAGFQRSLTKPVALSVLQDSIAELVEPVR